MVLAAECGVECSALLTDMNTPLGRAAGNWLEVKESVMFLEGNGPVDLEELVISCADQLPGCNAERASTELASGRPREKFNELLSAQGADLAAFETKLKRDATAPVVRQFSMGARGYLARCDAQVIGEVVRDLGGGRQTKESEIQPEVGLDQILKPNERVNGPLCRIHARSEEDADIAEERLMSAFEVVDGEVGPFEFICEIMR